MGNSTAESLSYVPGSEDLDVQGGPSTLQLSGAAGAPSSIS